MKFLLKKHCPFLHKKLFHAVSDHIRNLTSDACYFVVDLLIGLYVDLLRNSVHQTLNSKRVRLINEN